MADAKGPKLSEEQEAVLTELFHKLDLNHDGKLELSEFKRLGKAMTGREPTDEETRVQINRADKDSDAEIDLPEWLSFSSMLAKLPIETFRTTLAGYMEKLDKLAEEESKTE